MSFDAAGVFKMYSLLAGKLMFSSDPGAHKVTAVMMLEPPLDQSFCPEDSELPGGITV